MKRICYISVVILLIAACKKEKHCCVGDPYTVTPFLERYAKFECNGNDEYTYIFREKAQIDSLEPNCYIINSIGFPIDETDMVYIMVGKTTYHYRDTFYTQLFKDSCNKKLIYEVKMTQQDTAYNTFSGVVSMFCSVENIPEDYEVEVKYKYVPLE